MKNLKNLNRILIALLALVMTSCADDDVVVDKPTGEDAAFNYSFDPENPNMVIFKATPSDDNWYTHWDFGDNSSAEGYEASKVYLSSGDYDVRFKVFTEGGTAETVQTIVINQDFQGPNILQNGEFNGSASWIVLPITDGVDVSFQNDEATWSGGGGGQIAIYQPIQVLANNLYQISMDISGGPLTDSWFEVYVGMAAPVEGEDYTDGGIRLALNTWAGCGNEPFEGDFTDISCSGSGATFEFTEAGTAYILIRGGGANYGPNGVTIDNIAVRSLESSEVPSIVDFSFQTSGLMATFSNSSSNMTNYTWDFGDGSGTSTEENPSYTYSEGGVYNVTLTGSNDDETLEITKEVVVTDPMGAPTAGFTVETSNLTATFTNTSSNATGYTWDFGDGSGTSTEENPVYTYNTEGTYTVILTANNNGETTNEFSSTVTVEEATAANLISNGAFDDDSGWTIANQYEAENTLGSVSITDGKAIFNESSSSDWKHMGIYTSVDLQPGTYQFDMSMTYTDINDAWGEVYIGTEAPIQNQEYSGDQQILKAFNAWDCSDLKTYSGLASQSGCDKSENPGQFEITTAGTYYLMFRTGGLTYGATGITIDDISLIQVD